MQNSLFSFHTIKHIVLYISSLGWLAWVCLGFCETWNLAFLKKNIYICLIWLLLLLYLSLISTYHGYVQGCVCVGVLMGMYEWIATIDRLLQQLWANSNCLSCKVQQKWGLKSWTWSRALGKARREIEGRVACSECSGKRAVLTAMFRVCLRRPSTEAEMPKWWLAGETWVFVRGAEGWI